jgi:hypothetical protein
MGTGADTAAFYLRVQHLPDGVPSSFLVPDPRMCYVCTSFAHYLYMLAVSAATASRACLSTCLPHDLSPVPGALPAQAATLELLASIMQQYTDAYSSSVASFGECSSSTSWDNKDWQTVGGAAWLHLVTTATPNRDPSTVTG